MSIPSTTTVSFSGLDDTEAHVQAVIDALFTATQAVLEVQVGNIQSLVDPDNQVTQAFRDQLLLQLQADYVRTPIEQALGELKSAINLVLDGYGAPPL